MRPSSKALVALIAALCLVLSACSSASSDNSSDNGASEEGAGESRSAGTPAATPEQPQQEPPTETPDNEPEDEPDEAEPNPSAGGSGPIDNMLGIPVMDEGAFNDYLIDVIGEGERLTAECMLAEGFEYTPERPTINGPSAEGNTDSREYAEQVGFGIVAAFEAATFDGTTTLPPNEVYIASLTDGEREAYGQALFGAAVTDEASFIEQFGDGFPTAGEGCKALAIDELSGVFAVMQEFTPQAEDVFNQFSADPRIQESEATWSDCMADAGYLARNRAEAPELIWPQFETVFEGDAMFVELEEQPQRYDTSGIWASFLSGSNFGPHPPLTAEGQAAIDEIAEFETAVAVASFDCYEPLREAEMEIQLEYEQALVDQIGDQIGDQLGSD